MSGAGFKRQRIASQTFGTHICRLAKSSRLSSTLATPVLHCRSQKSWLCLAAILLLFPARLLAWGDLGHEIAGVIAYARLTPAAKGQVDALLASDRDTLTRPDFVSRTTWADEYRDSDRQTTKRRYEQTRNWHFVNIDVDTGRIFGCDRKLPPGTPASAGPAKACIIDKIDQFAAELRDPTTPRRETLIALKFLLHLVGDLHHPPGDPAASAFRRRCGCTGGWRAALADPDRLPG